MTDVMETVAGAHEPEVATVKHGSPAFVPFWVVKAGKGLYARSHNGPTARWYRQATQNGMTQLRVNGEVHDVEVEPVGEQYRTEIDAAYQLKYGQGADAEHVPSMLADEIVATTVRLTPVEAQPA